MYIYLHLYFFQRVQHLMPIIPALIEGSFKAFICESVTFKK